MINHLVTPESFMYKPLGKSKFALFGGKHSDDSMTTARSKMLDKIERQDMQGLNLNGDFRVHYPHDSLD